MKAGDLTLRPMPAKRAEEIKTLMRELTHEQDVLGALDAQLGKTAGIADLIKKQVRKIEALEKKIKRKVEAYQVSPELAAILKASASAANPLKKIVQSRFWTREQRKDMY